MCLQHLKTCQLMGQYQFTFIKAFLSGVRGLKSQTGEQRNFTLHIEIPK
jgi:hypothetical protein